MKPVPSYNQTSSNMDFRNYLSRDETLEPLPKNWEMAYTDTGMIYFIEWVARSLEERSAGGCSLESYSFTSLLLFLFLFLYEI